jgi:hypothetical protein
MRTTNRPNEATVHISDSDSLMIHIAERRGRNISLMTTNVKLAAAVPKTRRSAKKDDLVAIERLIKIAPIAKRMKSDRRQLELPEKVIDAGQKRRSRSWGTDLRSHT